MTPEEKAQELIDKFIQYTPVEYEYDYAKQCALIAVDEILSIDYYYKGTERKYWQQVKEEIEKL